MPVPDLDQAWSAAEDDCRRLVELALEEDLRGGEDITTNALVPPGRQGAADIVAREAGVACGLRIGPLVRDTFGGRFDWRPQIDDGEPIEPGQPIATLSGPARELLTCERTLLNFLGRLSGVATLTQAYARCVEGTPAKVYDTRKTTPGWRTLEKYAVACGGGGNHRMGLHDAVLIKDNHLAFAAEREITISAAIRAAREAIPAETIVEIEVDTLEQYREALPAGPDIILLDNMTCEQLSLAVAARDEVAPNAQLEASGGVTIETLPQIASTGVDRISVGALTHSAKSLDIGLDWR